MSATAPAIALADGGAAVEIAPRAGGAIAGFRLDGLDVLRPTPAGARDTGDVRAHACYPLVPYSNRIAQARLRWEGREHALARNFGDSPHAIHGVGWQRAWTVDAADAKSMRLSLVHEARGEDRSAWPWSFRAVQTVALDGRGGGALLLLRLALENTGGEPFPFGLGWHPFFPMAADTTLAFRAASVWESDDTRIPRERRALDGGGRYATPRRVADSALDHVFEGADGAAVVAWPDRGIAATIEADTVLDRRVVYTPEDRPFFAFEPVSHMTDAFNRTARGEAGTGTRTLGPGQAFSCTMRIRVRRSR